MQRKQLKQILDEAEEVKPIARTTEGTEVLTFQDVQKVNRAELVADEPQDLGERKINPDGTYACSNTSRVAIDPDTFYENRYKRVVEQVEEPAKKEGDKPKLVDRVKYYIVIDYRAIQEQRSGTIYTNNVLAFVVEKEKKGLMITGQEHISEREFVNDFTGRLQNSEMAKIIGSIETMKEKPNTDKFEF